MVIFALLLGGCGLTLELDPTRDGGSAPFDARVEDDARVDARRVADGALDARMPLDAQADAPDVVDAMRADVLEPNDATTVDGSSDGIVCVEETCNGADDDCDGRIDEDSGVRCAIDFDGDGHGDEQLAMVVCEESCPSGLFVADDCNDMVFLASPSLTEGVEFQEPHLKSNGTVSWDWDCDGVEEPRAASLFTPCVHDAVMGCLGTGWVSEAPACGETGTRRVCVPDGERTCSTQDFERVPGCR